MIPELAITTLACARMEPFTRLFCRIFRFGSSSRINDSECKMVITQMVDIGNKTIDLKVLLMKPY
jgi:acyl-coenzyme A synthetase/AMP-(fatty) acid ligase